MGTYSLSNIRLVTVRAKYRIIRESLHFPLGMSKHIFYNGYGDSFSVSHERQQLGTYTPWITGLRVQAQS